MTTEQHDAHVKAYEVRAQAMELLRALIEGRRADIDCLVQELAGHGWPHVGRFGESQRSNAGRPSTMATLERELLRLQMVASWLHATVVELRGEQIFASGSGADRLANLGVVSAPAEPVVRVKGRPAGRKKDELFLWWACVALMFARRKGNTVTVARAKRLAAEQVWPNLSKAATDLSGAIRTLKDAGSPLYDLWKSLQPASQPHE